ncbi:DNA primase [Methylomonas sp. SURF-2]|uniref:DNA primase n=1 Tax=Methylomonas subterranea TaxID=2952225 RepID=A0ABT1TKZ2_9GAMM|nr:DNA primase [Methylomonas sp. SURF-2]MCQ8106147.1 DNA primase [Methylomonas sp. SURF-2]
MSGRIPKQFIDDLLVRVDIVDLIDSHVPLRKAGTNYVARCPFHAEKTPSFSVSRTRQMYHCFGCGVSGNAISFLMDYSHLGFVEAVEDLAAFVGVEAPREEQGGGSPVSAREDVSRLYAVMEQVAAYYAEQLRGAEGVKAMDYLKARQLTGEVVREFGLGYAPNGWDGLLGRFDRQSLIDAGMLVVRDDGKVYDRFRGRLMFPIRDKRKRVIGFGGRVLDDALPKYLNSPETVVFSKSKELYGLCELLQKNSRPGRILVVEGYMDVIALAQCGVENAVATLGTATSKTHIDLLFRFASELVFCFDGDSAGRQAAWKATEAALPALKDGRQIRIMLLPGGHDPDSLIRTEGQAEFRSRINGALVLSDYFFESLSAQLDLTTIEGRAQLMAAAKPQLEKIPAGFFRDMMWRRLGEMASSRLVDVPENKATLRSVIGGVAGKAAQKRPSLVRRVLALLIQYPWLQSVAVRRDLSLEGLQYAGQELLNDVLRKVALEKPENGAILLESYRGSSYERAVTALAGMELNVPEGGEEAEFAGALTQLRRQVRQEKLSELLAKDGREGLTLEEKQVLRALLKESM